MPLGALIAQRWPPTVPVEARSQPTALAAATSVLSVDAVRQEPDVAEDHDLQAKGTAARDAALPASQAAPHPDAGPGAAQTHGSPGGPAQGLVSPPASLVADAGRNATPHNVASEISAQPWPNSRAALPAEPADQSAAAAAALSPAANATVDTAADATALQPFATVVAADVAGPEAGDASVMKHGERQQPQQPGGSATAPASAASISLLTPPAGIATDSRMIRCSADAARESPDSQVPPDAPVATTLYKGAQGKLSSNAVGLEVRSDGDIELPVFQLPDAASPPEVEVIAEAPNASLACAPEAAATPSAASPALLITTQDWHRLLGAGETDDAANSPSFIGRAADVTSLQALDDAVGNSTELHSPGLAVRPIVTSQDVVPDSDTSNL